MAQKQLILHELCFNLHNTRQSATLPETFLHILILKERLGSLRSLFFSVAKATLESQMSVCQSVRLKTPQPLRIAPINHQAYRP